jgi:hypothetical protein
LLRSSPFRGEFWIRRKEGKSDFQASDRSQATLLWSNMPCGGYRIKSHVLITRMKRQRHW